MEKEIELNIARGMSPEEARRQALIAFGGVQQTRENVRRVRWTHFVEVLAQDLRYGRRMLGKSPVPDGPKSTPTPATPAVIYLPVTPKLGSSLDKGAYGQSRGVAKTPELR